MDEAGQRKRGETGKASWSQIRDFSLISVFNFSAEGRFNFSAEGSF